jgi:hypothetical protein
MLYVDLHFIGFPIQIDSIEVRRYTNEEVYKDSFYLKLFQAGAGSFDGINTKTAHIRQLYLGYIYNFMIPGQNTYQLKNIKLKVYKEEKTNSSSLECNIGSYEIDGKTFDDEKILKFINREDKKLND